MRELGLFGTTIPEEHGGLGLGLDTYALIVIELSRGWMTLSGILNGSFIAATMIRLHGTDAQRERYLPATRVRRAPLVVLHDRAPRRLGRPVDPDARRPRRRRLRHHRPEDVGHERLALRARDAARQDRPRRRPATPWDDGLPRREGARDEPPGLEIPMPGLGKLGYKGVESTELVFDGFRTPAASVLGGEEGIGQRVQVLHERDRGRARQRRRARCRPRAGRARRRAPLRAGAGGVRQADRRSSGRAADDREDGDPRGGGPPAHRPGGAAKGHRRARRPRGRDGEVLRDRGGAGERARLHAHPRRLRLLRSSTGPSATTATRRCS